MPNNHAFDSSDTSELHQHAPKNIMASNPSNASIAQLVEALRDIENTMNRGFDKLERAVQHTASTSYNGTQNNNSSDYHERPRQTQDQSSYNQQPSPYKKQLQSNAATDPPRLPAPQSQKLLTTTFPANDTPATLPARGDFPDTDLATATPREAYRTTTATLYETSQSAALTCRVCQQVFQSSNKLHQHLRTGCTPRKPSTSTTVTCRTCQQAFQSKTELHQHLRTDCIPTKHTASDSVRIIDADMPTGQQGKWRHTTVAASVQRNGGFTQLCINSGCTPTLGDRAYLLRQGCSIKKIAMLQLNPVGYQHLATDEYVETYLYVPGLTATARIPVKIHVIPTLLAKLLIGSDTLNNAGMILNFNNHTLTIRTCEGLTVPIQSTTPPYTATNEAKDDDIATNDVGANLLPLAEPPEPRALPPLRIRF
ncbi:hypothetical protein K490DRAFT_69185 [Saccharata proteae CBS 121410]|uniref:C2H2-type domain-containing protein n=1 Tax=Saccharata proteae CBS 121410 TaxID=1314787 RepID=A0A9P4HPH7_9PEZI|nr:hypothetical protein K490DRAFT_69185 [Saccharata proteae CBS 121410]